MNAVAGNAVIDDHARPRPSDATAPWARRVLWVGGLTQCAFGAFWLVRGSATIGGVVGLALLSLSALFLVGLFTYARQAAARHCTATIGDSPGQEGRGPDHGRHRARVRCSDHPAAGRERGGSCRLDAAVNRDHGRTASALARLPGPDSPLPACRLGAHDRPVDPRRGDVRQGLGGHNRARCRAPPARYRVRRLPRALSHKTRSPRWRDRTRPHLRRSYSDV